MRHASASLGLLLTALLLPLAGAHPIAEPDLGPIAPAAPGVGLWSGPFVGSVGDSDTARHAYDTNAPGTACLDVYRPVTYTVRLAHRPLTDTLTLSVPAHDVSDDSATGAASVSFVANYCTRFTVEVTGTDVEDRAAYVVQVSSSGGGGAWS